MATNTESMLTQQEADFQSQVLSSLSRLETQMESLVGNGQPGRVTKIEDRVAGLEQSRSEAKGWARGRAAMVSLIVSLVALISEVFHSLNH